MLILLTNDDGIHSPGLQALRDHLKRDHDVFALAPERERTCVAHAITLHKPLRIRQVGEGFFSSNGTPADCVLLGVRILLPGRPDFILSGVNTGPNMGQDVNYSGTVAAAKEGARLGIPSLAVSLAAREDFLFPTAAEVTAELIRMLAGAPLPEGVFLNVNIPNLPRGKIRGFQVAGLGKRIYNDTVVERTDPRGEKYYWIGGNGDGFERIRGTDFCAVEQGYVSLTPLSSDGKPVAARSLQHIFRRDR